MTDVKVLTSPYRRGTGAMFTSGLGEPVRGAASMVSKRNYGDTSGWLGSQRLSVMAQGVWRLHLGAGERSDPALRSPSGECPSARKIFKEDPRTRGAPGDEVVGKF